MVTESSQSPKKRILVIDDDVILSQMLLQFLVSCGYEVFLEGNGSDALKRVLDLRPDLIILDVNLPGIRGTEVCKKIKTNSLVRDTPVLMITGEYIQVDDKVQGFYLGADDYIIKPIDISILAARIQSFLRKS